MNNKLIEGIKSELLFGENASKIRHLVSQQQEGEIHIFVKNGQPCKISSSTSAESVNGLDNEGYATMVDLLMSALEKFDHNITCGSLTISYSSDKGVLRKLNLSCNEEIFHPRTIA